MTTITERCRQIFRDNPNITFQELIDLCLKRGVDQKTAETEHLRFQEQKRWQEQRKRPTTQKGRCLFFVS